MRPVTEERRKHKRYKLENSVSVSDNGIFQIIDISKGGFCFRCPPYTSLSDSWDTDILTLVDKLEGFPAKRVRVSVTENGSHDYLPMVVGARFGTLTKNQDALLAQLIQTISQASSPEQ
jgi:hypothetical protein